MNFNSCKVLLTEHTQAMNHYMISWAATKIPISMIVSGGTMGGGAYAPPNRLGGAWVPCYA